jgi:SAM-dependent methyltransferase
MFSNISVGEVQNAALQVLSKMPKFWKDFYSDKLAGISEEISWAFVENGIVVDLGGASGFHCAICAFLGMKAICVDNFRIREKGHVCDKFYEHDLTFEKTASELGVEFIHTDLLNWEPPFPEGSVDVVMTFDNIEHLHGSPRTTYQYITKCLKSRGLFIIGAPNAVNLFKRLRVPLGKNIFANLEEWYLHKQFIGHVREPIVSDLLYIAKDLNITVLHILGRNWLGAEKMPKHIFVILDSMLRMFPTLCSNIYLIGMKC